MGGTVFTRAVQLRSSPARHASEPSAPDERNAAPPSSRRSRLRRRRVLALLVLLLLAVVVVLGVLAIPLWHARAEAKAAENHLAQAQDALSAHHLGPARSSIKKAQAEIDAAQHHANGFGSDVWSYVPVFGGVVDDARHLVDALDHATQVGALGTQAYAGAIGPHSKLVTGDTVDMPALERLATTVSAIGPHLDAAQSDVAAIHADAPFLGPKIATLRDQASTQLTSAQTSYQTYAPLMRQLPGVLGANGPRRYLIAMMNPSELRYSGGATLTMSMLDLSSGRISFGKSYTIADVDVQQPFLRWPRVEGNVLLRPNRRRLTAATFSPWWRASGEELSRAWHAQTGQHVDGVFAIDLQALAGLFRLTGPVQVAGYGELNAANLVGTLAGSYDRFQDASQRHALNLAVIPAFRQRFLEGGKFVQKAQLLQAQAQGRHFVTYFRDGGAQRAFSKIGFDGDLSRTPHDYIGVFSQNLNGSKTDYWQHRQITSNVDLHADGSAGVRLKVDVSNQAPPYALPGADPLRGYTTRYLRTLVGVFFPRQAKIANVTANGQPYTPHVRRPKVPGVLNRKYFNYPASVPRTTTASVTAHYKVPSAAEVTSDSTMTYELDVDPQDLVNPETLAVSVTFPKGWSATSLPSGWRATADGASWTGVVATKLHAEIPLEKSSATS
jgi:hypothetical protein